MVQMSHHPVLKPIYVLNYVASVSLKMFSHQLTSWVYGKRKCYPSFTDGELRGGLIMKHAQDRHYYSIDIDIALLHCWHWHKNFCMWIYCHFSESVGSVSLANKPSGSPGPTTTILFLRSCQEAPLFLSLKSNQVNWTLWVRTSGSEKKLILGPWAGETEFGQSQ